MFDYSEERERRARRFERHLQRLVEYRKAERTTDCALVFSTTRPDASSATPGRAVARQRSRSIAGSPAAQGEESLPVFRESHGEERFVQFAFMKRTFYLDLPRSTLTTAEADELLTHRRGFFRLRDRRWWFQSFEEWSEVVRDWNPVEKEYLNEDVRWAADELAHLFYTVWRYPLETRLYWQAFCFRRRKPRHWEGSGRLS